MRKRIFSLILVFAMVAALIPAADYTALAASRDRYTINVSGTYEYSGPQEMMEYINEERALQGRSPLTLDKDLTDAAMQRAAEIAFYFDHDRPDGTTCYTANSRMSGENIAAGNSSARGTYNQWYNSPGHYSNMINASFTNIGIGHFTQGGADFWVQVFSRDRTVEVEDRTGETAIRTTIDILEGDEQIRFNLNSIAAGEDLELIMGESFQLEAGLLNTGWPYVYGGIDPDTFTWSSSDESVISVDQTGLVTTNGLGTATVSATVQNGSRTTASIKIKAAKDLTASTVSYTNHFEYDGTAHEPEVTVTHEGSVLTEGVDYTVSYNNNINAGYATMYISGIGNYTGMIVKNFRISSKYIADSAVIQLNGWDYSQYDDAESCLAEMLSISYDNKMLTPDTDYYINGIKTDDTKKIITGFNVQYSGNYAGTVVMNCLEAAYIKPIEGQPHTGGEVTPEITVYKAEGSSYKYTEGVDYKVVYSNNIDIGTAKVMILPLGNSYGTAETTFEIRKDFRKAVITGITDAEYNGSEIVPDITAVYEGQLLEEGRDYLVELENNINAGTATVTLTGIGDYSGVITDTFKITPKDITGSAVVKLSDWHVPAGSDAWEYAEKNISVMLDGKALEYNKDFRFSGLSMNYDMDIISGLSISFRGNYTGYRYLNCLEDAYISDIEVQEYTGSEARPKIMVRQGQGYGEIYVEGEDYEVTYSNNVEIGTATVTVRALGDNYGTLTKTFQIRRDLEKATVSDIPGYVYTGDAIIPEFTVTHEGRLLEESIDYLVELKNNIDAGTATVTLTGIGEYNGTVKKNFKIARKDITEDAIINIRSWDYSVFEDAFACLEEMVDVTLDGRKLICGEDYYINSAGTDSQQQIIADFGITFTGNYSGSRYLRSLEGAYIKPIGNKYYTGSEVEPEFTLYWGDWAIYYPDCKYTEGVDYQVEYSNNIEVGTATITIIPIGDSYGSCEFNFNIVNPKYALKFKGNGGTVSKTTKTVTYRSPYGTMPTAKRAGYTFAGWYTAASGGTKVTASTVHEVMSDKTLYAHWNKVTVGKPYVKSAVNQKGKKLKVTVGKVTGAKGYQIVIAKNSAFTKGKKTAVVTSANYKIFKNLSKAKYYVKIRAYKLDSKGNRVYGKYSKVKTIQIKK